VNEVFVAGTDDGRATLWKNGVAQTLSSAGSDAYSVFVSGGDVFIAGRIYSRGSDDGWRATLWKNGVAQTLSGDDSSANSVFVSGGDVYVAGASGISIHSHPTLWKNGVAQSLGVGMLFSANSVFVGDTLDKAAAQPASAPASASTQAAAPPPAPAQPEPLAAKDQDKAPGPLDRLKDTIKSVLPQGGGSNPLIGTWKSQNPFLRELEANYAGDAATTAFIKREQERNAFTLTFTASEASGYKCYKAMKVKYQQDDKNGDWLVILAEGLAANTVWFRFRIEDEDTLYDPSIRSYWKRER